MRQVRNAETRDINFALEELWDKYDKLKSDFDALNIPADKTGWTDAPLDDAGYTDLAIAASSLKVPASAAPTPVVWKTNLKMPQFANTGGEFLHIEGLQLPHGYVEGTDLHPHIHFIPVTAIADTETVIWTMVYTIANIWAVYPATSSVSMTFTNNAAARAKLPAASLSGTNIVADAHLIADGATISGKDLKMSSVLSGRIERSAADTFGGNVLLVSSDSHIRINRIGSRAESSG